MFGKNKCQSPNEKVCLPLCIAKFFNIKLEELWNREQLNNSIINNGVLELQNLLDLVQKKFPNYTFVMIPKKWISCKLLNIALLLFRRYFIFNPTNNIEVISLCKTNDNSTFHAIYSEYNVEQNKFILKEDPYGEVDKSIEYKDDDVVAYCFFICNSYTLKVVNIS